MSLKAAVEDLCVRIKLEGNTGSRKPRTHKKKILMSGNVIEKDFLFEPTVEWFHLSHTLGDSREWIALLGEIKADPVLSDAPNKIGAWGQPDWITNQVGARSLVLDDDGALSCASSEMLSYLDSIRQHLLAPQAVFQARARVFGLQMEVPSIQISQDVRIVRLTENQLNREQPFDDGKSAAEQLRLLEQKAAIEFELTIPINGVPGVLLANEQATAQADRVFFDVVWAIQLLKSGPIELGPRTVSSPSFPPTSHITLTSRPWWAGLVAINSDDEHSLRECFSNLQIAKADSVLRSALQRFVLGRARNSATDRLVDYVIAWESILQTVGGNGQKTELGYRFSVNGAGVLHAAGAENDRLAGYKFMKAIYDMRSTLVHGGDESKVKKELSNAGFNSLGELCVRLEANFRKSLGWLCSLPINKRPYNEKGGWERLMWSIP